MQVRILAFAAASEAIGSRELTLALPDIATVATAFDALAARYPGLTPHRDTLAFAVAMTYVQASHPLQDGDELALIPPVSGG